jgi:hypothetical protein
MTSKRRRANVIVTLFVAAATFGIGPRQVRAQYGGYGGFGWGFGGFSQVEKPESFLYSKALIDAGRDTHIPSRSVYANNSNAYINHIRDNGFVERYDVARHDASYYRYAPPPSQPSNARLTPTAMTVPRQTPLLPLASFYNADHKLDWPADAPVAGELKDKQGIFDQASQIVVSETQKSGVASIATVTDARQKLLEYGRPALQYVRTHETARLADTFHLFLLSLYESLAQAVNPPTTAATAGSPAPTPSS